LVAGDAADQAIELIETDIRQSPALPGFCFARADCPIAGT
jgi:hypothetical protein